MVEMTQRYIRDEIELEYGKGLPKSEREIGNFPVYGSNGIIDYNNKPYFKGPGIIIGRKGTVGSVKYEEKDFWAIDTTYVVNLKNKNDNYKFWYYFLQTIGLEKMNTHSAIPGLNRDRVYNIKVNIPKSPKDREKISKILSIVDEKIKINTQINNILLQIAIELFKEELNSSKDIQTLENVIKFVKGKKPNDISNIKQENYEKYLTIACLNSQELNYANTTKMVMANNDLLMVMDGASSGDVYYGGKGVVGSTLARIDCIDNNYSSEFIYFVMKYYKELIQSKNTGSAIPHTDKVFVSSLEIPKITCKEQEKYKVI